MDVAAIMTEVGELLKKIGGLRVLDYEAPSVTGETAIVGYPDQINYNQQYGPEGFRFDLPIVLVAPNPTERRTRDKLTKYVSTSGIYSVKLALESPKNFDVTWTSYQHIDFTTVKSVTFDQVVINNIEYAGALFLVDVSGS